MAVKSNAADWILKLKHLRLAATATNSTDTSNGDESGSGGSGSNPGAVGPIIGLVILSVLLFGSIYCHLQKKRSDKRERDRVSNQSLELNRKADDAAGRDMNTTDSVSAVSAVSNNTPTNGGESRVQAFIPPPPEQPPALRMYSSSKVAPAPNASTDGAVAAVAVAVAVTPPPSSLAPPTPAPAPVVKTGVTVVSSPPLPLPPVAVAVGVATVGDAMPGGVATATATETATADSAPVGSIVITIHPPVTVAVSYPQPTAAASHQL